MLMGGRFHVFLSSTRAESSTSALKKYLDKVSHKFTAVTREGEGRGEVVLCSSGEALYIPQQLVVFGFVSVAKRVIGDDDCGGDHQPALSVNNFMFFGIETVT